MQEIKDLYISEKLDEEGGILDHIFGYKKIIDYTLKEWFLCNFDAFISYIKKNLRQIPALFRT